MIYNVSILDFKGRECELRIYPRAQHSDVFRCDDYGVIFDRKEYLGDLELNPFTEQEEYMKDLDEVERRKQESLRCSLSRTKTRIYQLARGEQWEWFFTFTFSPEKADRYNYEDCSNKLSRWLMRYRKKHEAAGFEFKYLIVPEQHKDGAWHFHGLFAGVNPEILYLMQATGHEDYRIFRWRFGFSSAEPIRDELAVANYISKYITKSLLVTIPNQKRYWRSRNLTGPNKLNLYMVPKREGEINLPDLIGELGDSLAHISQVDTPSGEMVYLQLNGSAEEVLDRLWPYWNRIEDLQEVL